MLTMYDDVTLSLIPADAEAVAGYVNGRWPTYAEVVRRWPRAKHLSVAVTSSADADCLDVEPGDATNSTAPAWVRRQFARGATRPVLYTSVSNAAALLSTLARSGISRNQVRLWTAHYTGREHLCSAACGFGMPTVADATQWTDHALGRGLDQSACSVAFFGAPPKPKPAPAPKPAPRPKPVVIPDIQLPPGYADVLRSQVGYDSWRQWRLGTGAWNGLGSRNPAVRPAVPRTIPIRWRLRLYASVA